MNVLERIVGSTREELERRRRATPLSQLEAALDDRPEGRPFGEALARPGISLIAEHKRRSPSAGVIREGATVTRDRPGLRARRRRRALDPHRGQHFGGALEDLAAAIAATELPVLRKDFIVDRYQLYESAAAGADAILLIAAVLDDDDLFELHREARGLDLDVLVEVHDEDELMRALDVDADIIGINNRDLGDFSVDIERTYELLSDVPAGKTVVSESGYSTREQLEDLDRVGVDAGHTGERTCFHHGRLEPAAPHEALPALVRTVAARADDRPEGSYTVELLADPALIGAKVQEEAEEVARAAREETDERVAEEAADVLYHLTVLLHSRGLSLADAEQVLDGRRR